MFDKNDVISVAKMVIELGVEYEMQSDYSDEGYFCNCCDSGKQSHIKNSHDFKHKLDCPVLKAQDLLTGHD